tara:strand:+ start:6973 stop:7209 length:237 start_codon:yes stop_codon:yes gene_type:complete
MNYLKYFVFYTLELIGATLNFLASIFCLYPKLELGMAFLIKMEGVRVYKQNVSRAEKREEYANEAEDLLREAKRLSNE